MDTRTCLHLIAPRLARARDQLLAERAEESRIDLARRAKLLDLERLVAHRELQLMRAFNRGNGRYIAERQRKLTQAKHRLRAVQRTAS